MATIQLSDRLRAWLKDVALVPETLELRKPSGSIVQFRILERDVDGKVSGIASRMGKKGFVLKVLDLDTNAEYAAKLCVSADYDGQRSEKDEAVLATNLRGAGDLFAPPLHIGRVQPFAGMPDSPESFVCFISDWIEGETIESLAQRIGGLTPDLVAEVSIQVVRALNYLKNKGLKHDDLHWGNVMVRPMPRELALSEDDLRKVSVVIIDLGSLKPFAQQTAKSKDDHLALVDLLCQMHNALWAQRSVVASHPVFIKKIRTIIQCLTDDDQARFYPRAEDLHRDLTLLRDSISQSETDAPERRFRPFEAISAEHLADDKVLLRLFRTGLPWFQDVLEPKPIVLTGPRGCGKSMIFRYMAVTTQINSEEDPHASKQHAGFGVYISCATHLQNHLLWIAREEGRTQKLATSISTYFQLVVLRELVRALGLAARDERFKKFFDLRPSQLDAWIDWISHHFDVSIETPRTSAASRLLHFADDLDRARVQVHLKMLYGQPPTLLLADAFLGDVTSKLIELCPRLKSHPVIFLLDDYTDTRINPEVQQILNRVVFERRSSHFFKISCERFGFKIPDAQGAPIDRDREFTVVDVGHQTMEVLQAHQARNFLKELIDCRLEYAGWKGRCETLIGDSTPYAHDNKLADFIRSTGSKQGNHYYYFGMTTLSGMWSGDIAAILQVVNAMCMQASVGPNTEKKISAQHQHQAIVAISKALTRAVLDYHPFGTQLYAILQAFGSMAHAILVKGTPHKEGNARRLYRLEISTDSTVVVMDELEKHRPEHARVARELLRRSVFHPFSDSRGKEGPGSKTTRWEMRPIFRPSFGLSLVREHYIDLKSVDDIYELLSDPKAFAEKIERRYEDGNRSKPLFAEEGDTP
ncbi:protein kinase family protein [Variovorax sp. MHTC-1]|uniref:ORC-CDC6 family AAA ATPase n=1 Tax=Variovorax sp. MHTC-1 TaxID=2495593 RepID=UPI000F85DF62|nr:protein kinase family protein [Variovorax sp. MHTC-1]RST52636.1 protein kinase family protein [Variovorax sp. MHTC-1]